MLSYPTTGGKGRVCLSFDDYHPLNLRIDEILHKEGICATFFIETREKAAQLQIRELFERGHEIGAHTIHHPMDLKLLHGVEAMSEIEGSKKMIESIIQRPCTVFAYPRGRFNDDVVAMVKKAGFEEARTTHVLKTECEDVLRMPTTVQIFNGRKEYNGRPWLQLAKFYLDHVVKNGGTLHIWGHANELEREGYWYEFEELVSLLGSNIEV